MTQVNLSYTDDNTTCLVCHWTQVKVIRLMWVWFFYITHTLYQCFYKCHQANDLVIHKCSLWPFKSNSLFDLYYWPYSNKKPCFWSAPIWSNSLSSPPIWQGCICTHKHKLSGNTVKELNLLTKFLKLACYSISFWKAWVHIHIM